MKRRFKFKFNGESPRSILIAYIFAKLKCDVYIHNLSIVTNSEKDHRIFFFSNSFKNLLIKFDIWNEIEAISYGVTSLSIKDNLVSEQLLIRTQNFSKTFLKTIGWTSKYLDIKSLLIKKLIDYDNVQFISKNQVIDKSLIFDYIFNFKNYDEILNLNKLSLPPINKKDEQSLIFNVYLRGHVEKRMYEINTTKGLLVLTPLNKNLYQIAWNYPSLRVKETLLSSKSLFLDNLITLLPDELIIDQIVGDVNILHISNIYSNYLIKNNSIYFNENKFKSNTIYDFNFENIIKNILKIYYYFENNEPRNIKLLNKFGFYYLLRKYVEMTINYSLTNSLFYLFKINNIFSLCIRKLLFSLLKKINLMKNSFY
tara:strand:+ start:431 stop:1537 length:1107 start_codon:yes stop_codon:yes gene_type:complete